MAYIIGEKKKIEDNPSLERMQEGYIQQIPEKGCALFVDKEGCISRLPINNKLVIPNSE